MYPMKPARRACACPCLFLLSCVLALPCRGQTVAYSAPNTGPRGLNADNGGLNIGHTFSVTGTNIQIIELGVYNFLGGQGLAAPHTVTVFGDVGTNHTPLVSLVVAAGFNNTYKNGFRFARLPTPLTLPPGNYSVIAYQMNGNGAVGSPQFSDPYADAGSETSSPSLAANAFTIYQFTTNASPAYPDSNGSGYGTSAGDLGSASFTYIDFAASVLTFPVARQVIQRSTNNTADIPVSGTVPSNADRVEARAVVMSGAGNNGQTTSWQVIALAPTNGSFSGVITNVAAGGWYRIEVRALDQSGNQLGPLLAVERVGVGEVFVVGGQSNSCSFGQNPQQVTDDHVSAYTISGNLWTLANDPQPNNSGGEIGGGNGSPWPHFGSRLVATLGVPVGIVSSGYGGTALSMWLPNVPNSHYPTLQAAVKSFPPNGFRAFLWHQGESDAQDGTPATAYAQMLNTIIAQSRTDAGWNIPWGVAQASHYVDYQTGNDIYTFEVGVNAGQRMVAFNTTNVFRGARTDDFHMENEVSTLDYIHFNTAGLTDHADQWVNLVLGQGQPVVKNPDFLANGAVADGTVVSAPLIGWTAFNSAETGSSGGSAGYYNPDHTFYANAEDNGIYGGVLPNMGSRQVAYFNGSAPGDKLVAQLPAMLAPHTRYILTLALGVRNSGTFGGYNIALTANGTALAQVSGSRTNLDTLAGGNAAGTFQDVALTYESAATVAPNQALDIQVAKTGGQIVGSTDNGSYLDFGNVRLYAGAIVPPAITLLTTNVAALEGGAISVLTTVTGVHPLSLQWYQSTNAGASFQTLAGQTNAGLALDHALAAQNGALFRLVASNDVGTATSELAHLTVIPNPNGLSAYGFSPLPLTSGSYNQDMVVEKTAPAAPTTATVDSGRANNQTTWFERGYYGANTALGIPVAGSTLTSSSQSDHSYRMAASYTANDAVLLDTTVTSATLTVNTPAAYSRLSFLANAGHGPTVANYIVHHADASTETGSLAVPDWFNNTGGTVAFGAGGRVLVDDRSFENIGNPGDAPYAYSFDIALSNTNSPVTTVALAYASGGTACFLALSGSSGGAFTPVAFSGYNDDMIFEAGAQPFIAGGYTTASMDGGTANTGTSWYEMGFSITPSRAPGTGLPAAGATFTSLSQADHHFKMPPSYTANNATYLDASTPRTITPAFPAGVKALSFLMAAAYGPVNVGYAIHHADATTESGILVVPDWFTTAAVAYPVHGRVNVTGGAYETFGNAPNLLSADIGVTNTTNPVTSIDLSAASTSGVVAIFAVSAAFTSPQDAFTSAGHNGDGSISLNFAGLPGYQYLLQFTSSLAPPVAWQNLATNSANSVGVWRFTDTTATNRPVGFYRALYLP